MPLFELYRMSKEKIDYAHQENPPSTTDSPTIPESDFAELLWENGPILMQGQSSRAKRNSNGNTLPSYCLPSHSPKSRDRDRDVGNGISFKSGKSGPLDLFLNDIPLNMNQDDEMGPWLNCHIDDEPFHPGYNSDFLNEFSGVTVNDLSAQSNNNFASFDRRSSSNYQLNKEFNTLGVNNNLSSEHENLTKISSVEGDNNPPTSSSQPQYQTSFPCFRPKFPNNNVNSVISTNVQDPSSSGSFRGLPMLKQDPRIRSDNNSGLINFSHFSRPVSLYKAISTPNTGAMPSCSIRIESIGNKDKGSAASSTNPNPVEVTNVNTSIGLRREMSSNCNLVETKPIEEPPKAKICQLDASKYDNGKNVSQTIGESAIKGVIDGEKTVELVVASSSVGSGNSVDGASDDPKQNLKRKHRDSENSECPSGDIEEDSVGVKKTGNAHTGTASKRSRAAEVHNLSERRRRDRINEKMRALQELIPNCNKVDKASMLDEAIEYLKTLQLQVQIMSMGTGYYMSPMMFAPGMPQMHAAAHMAHFSPMGLGMGMGMGLAYGMGMPDMNCGSSSYPTVQVPPLHGPHYPGPPVSGSAALHGMPGSNFPYYGIPSQALPATMSHAPSVPLPGGSATKPVMGLNSCGVSGPMNNVSSATGSKSKSPVQNGNPEIVQSAGANSSVGQSSNQVQATNESTAQPVGVQGTCQAAEVTVLKPLNSPKKNEKLSIKEIGYD